MNRGMKLAVLATAGIGLLACILLFSEVLSFGYFANRTDTQIQRVTTATVEIEGEVQTVTLPHVFRDLSPRQSITVTVALSNLENDYLYVKSIYAPLEIYGADDLLYASGQAGTYPGFFRDPAMETGLVKLPDTQALTVTFHYQFPTTRQDLWVGDVMVGSADAVGFQVFSDTGVVFILAVILGCSALLFMMIGFFVASFEKKGICFIWLGLIAFLCAMWSFGECAFSGLVVENASFLYLYAFIGMMYLPTAVTAYLLQVIPFSNPKPVTYLGMVNFFMATGALVLQLLGRVSLYQSALVMQPAYLVMMVFVSVWVWYESMKWHNLSAKRFRIPCLVLTVATLLEVLNYVTKFHLSYCIISQVGLLVFIATNGMVGGLMIRDAIHLREENRRMEYEHTMVEHQMSEQRRYYGMMLETRQALKQQRHDLRHQLRVIQGLLEEGETQQLTRYLRQLTQQVPAPQQVHCDNVTVNAMVGYYHTMARQAHIDVTIQLELPTTTQQISDSALCVLFGNMMENAIEACTAMTQGHRYLRLISRIHNGMLIITQDNSFDGKVQKVGESFQSVKERERGVGLDSIRTIAEKHGGDASFEAKGTTFFSSVYVQI